MYYILRQFWTLFCDFKDIVWDGKQNMPSNVQNYIKKLDSSSAIAELHSY